MRVFVQIIAILVASVILELFLPWWSIAIAGFLVGYGVRARLSFINGFVAISIVWLVKILIIQHAAATPLAEKVAHIFSLPGHTALIVVTILIGGVVGGMATLTGSLLHKST